MERKHGTQTQMQRHDILVCRSRATGGTAFLISSMSDGLLVEINLIGANREKGKMWHGSWTYTVAIAPPAAHRESREQSQRLAFSPFV